MSGESGYYEDDVFEDAREPFLKKIETPLVAIEAMASQW